MTSSIFATTVVACFAVVALPHVLPCPAPKTRLADGSVDVDGRRRLRRQQLLEQQQQQGSGFVSFPMEGEDAASNAAASRRECPVPKPGGMLGEWLGFHGDDKKMER